MKSKATGLLTCLVIGLVMALPGTTVIADDDDDSDRAKARGVTASQADYWFVGHLGQTNDEGMPLIWEGVVSGAINGEGKWYFAVVPPVVEDPVFFFYEAKWEIWKDGKLVLAGESAGKTVFREGVAPGAETGVWDGHGVVTFAKGKYRRFKGLKIYESGPVHMGDVPPVTFYGTGMILFY